MKKYYLNMILIMIIIIIYVYLFTADIGTDIVLIDRKKEYNDNNMLCA